MGPTAEIVDCPASARHVLHEIETGTVDLLITNCHMTDMDGPTLVRTLREQKHSIPIVMVSGMRRRPATWGSRRN